MFSGMILFVVLRVPIGVAIFANLFLLELVGVVRGRAHCLGVALHAHRLVNVILRDRWIGGAGREARVRKIASEGKADGRSN